MTRFDPRASSPSIDAFVPGAVFVHRATGYVFRQDVPGPEADGSPLRLSGVGEYRFLTLPPAEAQSQLRLPMDAARAEEIERLIVHEASVIPDPDLDILLYLRGTPEQAGAAIATLMDRLADARDDRGSPAASDLRFQRLKLLGELAWVKRRAADLFGRTDSRDLQAYEDELCARRRDVPRSERRSTVAPPHVPVVPSTIVTMDRVDEDGWHVLETRLAPSKDWLAASLGHWKLEGCEELPAAGELVLSTLHRDGAIRWIVLSEHEPACVEASEGAVRATLGGETIALQSRAEHRGQVLVVVHKAHPPDLLESIDVRLRYPDAQMLVWTFGLAVAPGTDSWTAFCGRSARGSVWAFACGGVEGG